MGKKKTFKREVWETATKKTIGSLYTALYAVIFALVVTAARLFIFGGSSAMNYFQEFIVDFIVAGGLFTIVYFLVYLIFVAPYIVGETQNRELSEKNSLPTLKIMRDEEEHLPDELIYKIENIDKNNLDLSDCRINLKKLVVLQGNANLKFNPEKNNISFAWERKVPIVDSPYPGKPVCVQTVKFQDYEYIKILKVIGTNPTMNNFWVEFYTCDGTLDRVDSTPIDEIRSVVGIEIKIELVGGFGSKNIIYPLVRRIHIEKELSIGKDDKGKLFYPPTITITDLEWKRIEEGHEKEAKSTPKR